MEGATTSKRMTRMHRVVRSVLASALLALAITGGTASLAGASEPHAETTFDFLNRSGAISHSATMKAQARDYVLVRLANTGTAPSSNTEAPQLRISLPAGSRVIGVQSLSSQRADFVAGTWHCQTLDQVVCEMRTEDGSPVVFPAGTQTLVAMTVKLADLSARTPKPIEASATLAGGGTRTRTLNVSAPAEAGLVLTSTGPDLAMAGTTTQVAYQVINPSDLDAAATPNLPAVSLSNLLPAGKFDSWSSTSPSWQCSGDQSAAPSCVLTDPTLAAGEHAPPLVIMFHVPAGTAAKNRAQLAGSLANWTVNITETVNGESATGTQSESLLFLPRPASHLTAKVRVLDNSLVQPGQSVTVEFGHLTLDGFAGGATDTITLPKGFSVPATTSNGWACPAGTGTIVCEHADALVPGSTSVFALRLTASDDAKQGAKVVRLSSTGNAGEATDKDWAPLFVLKFGGPVLKVERVEQLANGSYRPVKDGSKIDFFKGVANSSSYAITNTGNRALPVGTTISVTVSMTDALVAYLQAQGITTSPVQIGSSTNLPEGTTCAKDQATASFTCTRTLSTALAPNKRSNPFTFQAKATSMLDVSTIASLAASARAALQDGRLLNVVVSAKAPGETVHSVTLDLRTPISAAPRPDLSPRLSIDPTLEAGAPASTVTLSIDNVGAAMSNAGSVTFTLPASLAATGIDGSACTVSAGGGALLQTVTCQVPKLGAGSPDAPTSATGLTFKLANLSATEPPSINVAITIAGKTFNGTPFTVPVTGNHYVQLAAPTDVMLTQGITADSLQLSFTPSANAPLGQEYRAKVCTNVKMTANCLLLPATPQSVLTGLDPDTAYYVVVVAVGKNGYQTATSAVVNARTLIQLAAPGDAAVTTGTDPGTLSVSYIPSANAPANQAYEATACTDEAMTTDCIVTDVTLQSTISGLTDGTTYYVVITATSSPGYAAASAVAVSADAGATVLAQAAPTTGEQLNGTADQTSTTPQTTSGNDAAVVEAALHRAMAAANTTPKGGSVAESVKPTPRAASPPSTGYSFCDIWSQVASAVGNSIPNLNVGGQISISINGAQLSGANCSAVGASISFTSATLNLYGQFSATVGASTINSTAFSMQSASITTPNSWPGGSMTLGVTGTGNNPAITMPFDGSQGNSSVHFLGSFLFTGGPFGIPLDTNWTGSTNITFDWSNSATTITITSSAHAPSGGDSFTVNGTATTTGTFSVNVLGTMSLGSVHLRSVSAAWSTGHPFTSSATAVIGSASIGVDLSYTDGSNWSFQVHVGSSSTSGTIAVASGISIGATTFTGSISETSGTINWSMAANLPSVTIIPGMVTLQNPTFSISNQCPTAIAGLCTAHANDTILSATGTIQFQLGLGLGSVNISLVGGYGVQSGGFEINAIMPNVTIVPGLLTIKSPSLAISYGEGATISTGSITAPSGGALTSSNFGGYTVSVGGSVDLSMPGFNMTLPALLTYLPSVSVPTSGYGFNLTSDFPSLGTLGSTGAVLSDFAFSSSAQTINLNGLSVSLPANTLTLGGSFVLPTWVATYIGSALPNVKLFATYTSPTWYSTTGTFSFNLPMPTGSSDFSFSITGFSVGLAMGPTGYTQSLSASGTFTISGSAGNSTIGITLGMTYQDATATITGSITAQAASGYLWSNCFGMPGVNLSAFAIQVGITLSTTPIPLPSLGFAANLTITGSLASSLGIQPGTNIQAILNLSVANPCMDVQISQTGSGPAISIGGGLFTATYAHFALAPDGCTVGTFVVAPGYAFDFDGTFFGVAISVSSQVSIAASGGINYTGDFSVGAFNIQNYLNFQGANISMSEIDGVFACSFSGAATILGVTVSLSGGASADPNTGSSSMSLAASISSFSVYGFTLSNVAFAVAYTQTPSNLTFTLSASGTMSILGSTLSVEQMTFTFSNGVVSQLYIAISADITVKVSGSTILSINGNFTLNASSSSSTFLLTATGSVSMPTLGMSFTIAACPNNQPGLTISNTGFTLCSATFSSSFFTATISGSMYWDTPPSGTTILNSSGTAVAASAGDFYFSATNVSLNICGFGVYGAVTIGKVGSSSYASVSAALRLSNTSGDAPVSIAGFFDSSGNFSFTGQGSVKLAGISFYLAVNASQQGSATSVSVDTNLSISGANFSLTGTFNSVSGGVSTNMTLTADLTISGFALGQATITLAVKPGLESVTISDSMSLGGIFTASLNGTLGAVNGTAIFNFSLSAGIYIPGISVSGSLMLSNCNSNCTATAPFSAKVTAQFTDFAGTKYQLPSVGVNADWSWSASSSGSTNYCSGATSLGLIRFQSCFSGSYSVAIMTSSPYLSFSLAFNASIKGSNWKVSTHCHGKWYNPKSWKCDTTSSWGSWYNVVSVGASVDSKGNVTASYSGINFSFKI